jgi:NADPH-dependent glutamate synthase beta subunit-like oxidoreductase
VTKERNEVRDQVSKVSAQVKEVEKKLADAEAKIAAAPKGNRFTSPKTDAVGGPGNAKPMAAMADMMKSPAMREMVKQQTLAQMDMQYGKLFQRFQLDGVEKDNFKQLIGERMQAEVDAGLKMMGGDVTPEQRSAMLKEMTDAKKVSDEKIKTFLNSDDDYKAFTDWEDTKGERMQLTMGASAFTTAGEPLNSQQEDQLVAAMRTARMQAKDVPDMNKPENATPSNFTPAMMDKFMASYDRQAQRVLADSAKFLSPKQLEALKNMQQQMRSMQEAGLKMSGMMFGGGKK